MDISKYVADIKKFTKNKVDEKAVAAMYKRMAGVLGRKDASTVAASDKKELSRVKYNFISKRLGVKGDKAQDAIEAVCAKMKKDRSKNRLTFYYLVAEELGKLAKVKK